MPVWACASIPPPHILTTDYQTNDGHLPEKAINGKEFCRDIAINSNKLDWELGLWGWVFNGLALITGGTGTVLIATNPDSQSDKRKILNASMPIAAATLAYAASNVFTRKNEVDNLAATATLSLNGKDETANEECNKALADWTNGLTPATALLQKSPPPQKTEQPPGTPKN